MLTQYHEVRSSERTVLQARRAEGTLQVKEADSCGKPEAMRRNLERHNIESRHLWKPMHLQPVFSKCPSYVNGVSEDLFSRGLCIPAGPWVGEKEIARVVEAIKESIV